MTTFGNRLRTERKRLNMTQIELAAIGEVQKNAQISYEKDVNSPTAAYLTRIATAGVDLHYLFYEVYSDTAANQQFSDLLSALHILPPEHQAVGFGMLSMLGQLLNNGEAAQPNLRNADELWRAARLYNRFLSMDEKERQVVEATAEVIHAPPQG